MIYATIGIPLMLAALHDLGTFLTDLFKIFHKKILVRLSKRLCSKNKIAPENQKKPSEMGQNRISSETLRTPWHSFIDIRINQEAEDNISSFNYPIVVGIFIVIVWIVSCAAIFQPWEGWSLFDGRKICRSTPISPKCHQNLRIYLLGIYFFFISLTTIGFGMTLSLELDNAMCQSQLCLKVTLFPGIEI